MSENTDQRALRTWIQAGLLLPEVRTLNGDARYIFNNMIAKYTLAASEYLISIAAEQELNGAGIDLEQCHVRSRLYGRKRPWVFEHAIPATIVRKELLATDGSESAVRVVLNQAGPVAVLTRVEDDTLRRKGLNSKMPPGWNWGDNVLARYHATGVRMSTRKLLVKGAIKR